MTNKTSRAERERRLREMYPLGAVPRQDMPRITGHKASSMAAMAQREQGPPFYRRGKMAVYPIGPLLDWVEKLENKPSKAEVNIKDAIKIKENNFKMACESTLNHFKKAEGTMSYVKSEDIRGAQNDEGKTLCVNCMGDTESYKEKDLILEPDIEKVDGVYFCDECGNSL